MNDFLNMQPVEYLSWLKRAKDRYLVIINVMGGDTLTALNDELTSALLSFGGVYSLSQKNDWPYVCIIDEGYVVFEKLAKPGGIVEFAAENYFGNLDIRVVSKTKSTKKVFDNFDDYGIFINNNCFGYDRPGLNIVVFDKHVNILIDAVNIDTNKPAFPMFRFEQETTTFLSKLSEITNGLGYTAAQWLVDLDFEKLIIIADLQFAALLRQVLVSNKVVKGITICGMFSLSSKNKKLTFIYDNVYHEDAFDYFTANSCERLSQDTTVLYISPFQNVLLKNKIVKKGVRFFHISNVIASMFLYISSGNTVAKLISEVPGLKAISFDIPNPKLNIASDSVLNKLSIYVNKLSLESGIRKPPLSPLIAADTRGITDKEWLELLGYPNPKRFVNSGGMVQLESKESKYINIADGHRITLGNPEHYDNTVYIFGNCNFFGAYNTDMDTCSSQLQRLLNDAVSGISKVWRVQNYGLFISNNLLYYPNFIYSIREKVKPGDVILYQSYSSEFSKLPHISFSRDIISPEYGILYHDKHHFSNNMHRYIADKFFKFLCENEFFEDASMDFGYKTLPIPVAGIQIEKRSAIGNVPLAELQPWLESIRKYRPRIGSIVMNCNPFTLGHRYLIEQSASTVEKLFIFVVEEDKSVFPFADRIELVRQGTADLPNVTVLPSGKFIISQLTFTDYFGKSEMQDKTVDPSMDVELFARHIAPALGITVRFAGEEPLDNVTRQYNEAMTRILPYHGVAFEVIPRKGEQGGGVISASKVRKLLEAKDFDEIEKIVPASTLEYLRRNVHK